MIFNQIKYFAKAKIKPQSGIQSANIVNLSDIKARLLKFYSKNPFLFQKYFVTLQPKNNYI